MPRPRKSARLWLRPARDDRDAVYVILDGGKEYGTGCGKGDAAAAERALQEYLRSKHDPKAKCKGDPNLIPVADAISIYWMGWIVKKNKSRPDAVRTKLDNLLDFFGTHTIGEIDGPLQERYVEQRSAAIAEAKDKLPAECQSAPRRELQDLSAAINFSVKKAGGVSMMFRATLPDDVAPRDRCLTRSEAARLILAAWRHREVRNGKSCGRRTAQHVARFILLTLYTGSRKGDVCNAALIPTIGRGYIDVETGIFRRKPSDKRETNKRQPTIPLPPRLLAHLRRWKRLNKSVNFAIEWQGEAVNSIKTVWPSIVKAAGLETDDPRQKVVPHVLRHTAISWYLDDGVPIDKVSDYCGVSEATIRRVYKHHLLGSFDGLLKSSQGFGRGGNRHRAE